jgi:Flp pilus assembly protein TadD
MIGISRSRHLGQVLAAGALIGLAGCQHLSSRPGASPGLGRQEAKTDGPITPAQEADVQISLGRAAEQQGDLEQAMAAYRAALGRDKRRADAYLRLAVLHDKQGKFRESAEWYRKALALRPGDPDIFCDMGYSFYLQRRWAESEMNLRQALAVNPEHPRAHNNLALVLVRNDRLKDALAEFGKGGSDPVQAHHNLAFALTMDRRWDAARAEYQRVLALDPASKVTRARLDQLNGLLAKLEPARAGAPHGPELLTNSTGAPGPRPDVPGPTPPESARSLAPRDPALLTTATTVDLPRLPASLEIAAAPRPVVGEAMVDQWWADGSATGTPPPRRQSGPATGAPAHRPEQPTARPRPQAPRAENASGSSRVVDSRSQAPASSRSPKRASTRRSKLPEASPPIPQYLPQRTRSTPVLPPDSTAETASNVRSPQTPQTDNLPPLPSIP